MRGYHLHTVNITLAKTQILEYSTTKRIFGVSQIERQCAVYSDGKKCTMLSVMKQEKHLDSIMDTKFTM
jgi:hypothetical protein